jgi:hypothetical protein
MFAFLVKVRSNALRFSCDVSIKYHKCGIPPFFSKNYFCTPVITHVLNGEKNLENEWNLIGKS